MAKRPDEEEEEVKIERKRRRPKKKPVDDEEDDAPAAKGGEDEEEENSLSTGNVFLDIILDFRDDCIDWARDHFPAAVAVGITALLLTLAVLALSVRYVINYINRPTLLTAIAAYDLGSYPEAKRICNTVLKYTAENDFTTRAGLYFILGASTVSIADIAWDSDRQPYYLAAAKYLKDSAEYGFLPDRQTEGFFLLGKSLYMSSELIQCRQPLERALEFVRAGGDKIKLKQIYWFLANSYFLDAEPDLPQALKILRTFQKEPTVTDEERHESDLMAVLILVQLGSIEEAEKTLAKVPLFEKYKTIRLFAEGVLAYLTAKNYKAQAEALENNPNPIAPVAAGTPVERLKQQAAEHFQTAIGKFVEMRQREIDNSHSTRWRRQAELLEGLSYQESGEPDKAQAVYLRIGESYPAYVEAASAHFLWAELERQFGRTDAALRGYAAAFNILRQGKNRSCPWFTRETMLQRCETMIQECIPLKEYRDGLTVLHIVRNVMPQITVARLRGETYEDWAVRLKQQTDTTFGDEGNEKIKEKNDKYNKAAIAFDELARLILDQPDYGEYLRRSAEDFRLAHNYRQAIPQYQKYLKVNRRDNRPETDYYIAEMYLHLDGIDQCIDTAENALEEFPQHPLVPRLRILLSRAYNEKNEPKKAEELLRTNLIGEYAPSAPVYRDSMFALAKMLYEQNNLNEAVPYLEDAVKNYPAAIQTPEAHYFLAHSYLHRASELEKEADKSPLEDVRKQVYEQAAVERQTALEHIQQAEELLTQRQNAVGLTEAEQLMLRNTLFGAGTLMMKLKLYNRAIPVLNVAATRYKDQPAALDALMQLTAAFRELGKPDEAVAALNRADFLVRQLEKTGTLPKNRDWKSLIKVQKDLIANP
ncbi:MAG: tetratricopeptide repeat protein [Planctomycetaceae bacterium]|jgi:tetratricopeptide (TPR) repeat protein|nr:tetratricopeptide repeat protein [Planctomycetaceae bacterium]